MRQYDKLAKCVRGNFIELNWLAFDDPSLVLVSGFWLVSQLIDVPRYIIPCCSVSLVRVGRFGEGPW